MSPRLVWAALLFLPLVVGGGGAGSPLGAGGPDTRLEAGETATVQCDGGRLVVTTQTHSELRAECMAEEPTIPPPP